MLQPQATIPGVFEAQAQSTTIPMSQQQHNCVRVALHHLINAVGHLEDNACALLSPRDVVEPTKPILDLSFDTISHPASATFQFSDHLIDELLDAWPPLQHRWDPRSDWS